MDTVRRKTTSDANNNDDNDVEMVIYARSAKHQWDNCVSESQPQHFLSVGNRLFLSKQIMVQSWWFAVNNSTVATVDKYTDRWYCAEHLATDTHWFGRLTINKPHCTLIYAGILFWINFMTPHWIYLDSANFGNIIWELWHQKHKFATFCLSQIPLSISESISFACQSGMNIVVVLLFSVLLDCVVFLFPYVYILHMNFNTTTTTTNK